jgi:hypothetical protein
MLMAKADSSTIWQQLSEVEQTYLTAIFMADQAQEVYQRQQMSRKPASEWRWIPFNRSSVGELTMRLKDLNHTQEQSLKIFKKLKQHGLIDYEYQRDNHFPTQYLCVKITKQGRALVRAATGAPRKALTGYQRRFAHEVVQLGLATQDEAYRAFETRNDAQIAEWKPAVEQLRMERRHKEHEELSKGKIVKTEVCAWCGGPVEIKVYPASHYAPDPIRRIHISYDDEDHWIEQYGCCPECVTRVREAKVKVILEREENEK